MLFFVLLLILAFASCYFIFTLSNTNSVQRKQLITLTLENNTFKANFKKQARFEKQIVTIKYKATPYKSGIISDYCPLYAAPIEASPVLCELSKNTQIKIMDSAEAGNSIWYEVAYNKKDNINNKGWIKARYMMIYDTYDLTRN